MTDTQVQPKEMVHEEDNNCFQKNEVPTYNKMFSKNILQQYCQQKKLGQPPHLPEYKVTARGPTHRREFQASVIVGDQMFSSDQWYSKKKIAEIEVAALALEKLNISQDSVKKKNEYLDLALERVNYFFENYYQLLKELRLDTIEKDLPPTKKRYLLKNLTFAFLHASVNGFPQCRLLIKQKLGLSDSTEVVDYNGLEFLGDAVLQFLVTKHLYVDRQMQLESSMSKTRAKMVNRQRLNQTLIESKLDRFIMYTGNLKLHETSIPGDVFEAIIGAICVIFGEKESERVLRDTFNLF